jgi:hypothetical protein
MVYRKRMTNRRIAKKIYRKGKSPFKSYMNTKKLVKLISKVSLKKAETKETHRIEENINLFHNGINVKSGLLYTQQGLGDNDAGTSSFDCRVGNEIVARGLSIKMWFANKLDRPNVMYKVIVFRYRADQIPSTIFKNQGTANVMLRDVDTDRYTVLAVKQFNLNQGAAERIITATDSFAGTEGHIYKKFWINMKNRKIQYTDNNSGSPKYYDIGFSVSAYDSYGTLTSDNIASYAFNCKMYFKDP